MSSKTPGPGSSSRRLLTVIAVFVVILVVQQCIRPSFVSLPRLAASSALQPPRTTLRIEGQWKHVRQSLGLPLLLDEIIVEDHDSADQTAPPRSLASSSARFFRFKRSDSREQADTHRIVNQAGTESLPTLYFAQDALQERKMSYDELRKSFRSIMMREKKEAEQAQLQEIEARRRKGYRGRRWAI